MNENQPRNPAPDTPPESEQASSPDTTVVDFARAAGNRDPVISCVVNAHHEGQILYPTLRSVERARRCAAEFGLATELIIVLDKPDEPTREVAGRFADRGTRIEEVTHGDLAESRNHAVQIARGRFTTFLDGDDLWCRTWLVDCHLAAQCMDSDRFVLHPEYNVMFGNENAHVFNHVDMESRDFELENIYFMNYWTALSFAPTQVYRDYPYTRNRIGEGFGFEDWTWNVETIRNGFVHKVAMGTAHYVRIAKNSESLLKQTNTLRAVPRIHNIYSRDKAAAPAAPAKVRQA
ncbi:MAG: glycosyltransferase [Gammaproteobacteria bacterium]|nr:MAG: glycosyltransferase [Gammaproteobacteria bacterium]